jgi:acyl-CoA oxidase
VSDLRRERRGATFDIWELSALIHGGQEEFEKWDNLNRLVMSDAALAGDDLWWISRQDRYVRACDRAERFIKICRDNSIPFFERSKLLVLLGEDCFVTLHNIMFVPTLMNLADDEQQSWWLAKADQYKILGTYAQTELTHGSNVRGLKTTATFVPGACGGDGGWDVHTPSVEGMKWWPGGLAKSCNTCILMAKVIIDGKNYGPHPFFFQVRDFETHQSLPGIELIDIGQKLGYNGMDNGGMRISHVLIPRRNLLMRYTDVDTAGNYKKIGDQKMLFGTMTYTRMLITTWSGLNLAKAVTTSVRYSAVRRQFAMQRVQFGESESNVLPETTSETQQQLDKLIRPSKRDETQVLDYSTQQYLLFPQLALAFALHFAGQYCEKCYFEYIEQFRAGDFSRLQELHVLTSTLKAVSSMLATEGMESCRKSLGGHGYLNSAGVGPQFLSALPQATYEGDFVVLANQVGSNVLKKMAVKTADPNMPSLAYIWEHESPVSAPSLEIVEKGLSDHSFLHACLVKRANYVHHAASASLKKAVATAPNETAALDMVKIDMMRMTYAHAYVLYSQIFLNKLKEDMDPEIRRNLQLLYKLYCLTLMDSSYDKGGGFGEFCAAKALPPEAYQLIFETTKKVLAEIRPAAVPLVDAWNLPDYLLNSCLGRYDGRVYEALLESTQYEPLNDTDVSDGYYKHVQYILHPERRQESKL